MCTHVYSSQAKKPVRLYSVQHCINKLLGTSSAVTCTHTVQLHCFHYRNSFSSQVGPEPDGPERGQLTPCPSAGWKGPLSWVYPPFLSEESFPAWLGIGRVPFPGCGQGSKQELLESLTQTGWLGLPILQFRNRKENYLLIRLESSVDYDSSSIDPSVGTEDEFSIIR